MSFHVLGFPLRIIDSFHSIFQSRLRVVAVLETVSVLMQALMILVLGGARALWHRKLEGGIIVRTARSCKDSNVQRTRAWARCHYHGWILTMLLFGRYCTRRSKMI